MGVLPPAACRAVHSRSTAARAELGLIGSTGQGAVYRHFDMKPARPSVMDDANLVRVLKALADPKRFRMVQEVAHAGELSCGQVGGCFGLSQPTISHHLKIPCDAGVLRVREEGQHHFISVDRELMASVSGALPARLAPSKRPARARR